jgi:SAM-dependent methyltransferase
MEAEPRHDAFADRATGWEDRFAQDAPRYAWAASLLAPRPNDRVLDVGCGTARLAPTLRTAVGPSGGVVGIDPSPAMLGEAVRLGRATDTAFVVGAAEALPVVDGWADGVLAAGLLPHLEAPSTALRELGRVTRPGGRLVVFHPVSRAQLLARHAGLDTDDHVLAPARLTTLVETTGWSIDAVHDLDDRFALVATRVGDDEARPVSAVPTATSVLPRSRRGNA